MGQQRQKFYVKPVQSPESAVGNASENIVGQFSTEEFQAKRKNGNVGTFTYDRKGLKNVSGSIFSYVVQMAKNNYRLEQDQRGKNTREFYEYLPRNKWKSE